MSADETKDETNQTRRRQVQIQNESKTRVRHKEISHFLTFEEARNQLIHDVL